MKTISGENISFAQAVCAASDHERQVFQGDARALRSVTVVDHGEVIETRHYVDYATQLPIIEYEHKDGYRRVEIDIEKLLVNYCSGVALAFVL